MFDVMTTTKVTGRRLHATRLLRMALVLLVLAQGACSSAPKSYGVRGAGDVILNRDAGGNSLSVVVRIYQLKDAREFAKLTFDTLADGRSETGLLGAAVLEKTDVIIVPGGNYSGLEKLLDETRFVAIVGFFRRPDAHYWRQLADAETVRRQGLSFRVQDCYVVLTGTEAIALPGQPTDARPTCGAVNAAQAGRALSSGSVAYEPGPLSDPAQRAGVPSRVRYPASASPHGIRIEGGGIGLDVNPLALPGVFVGRAAPGQP